MPSHSGLKKMDPKGNGTIRICGFDAVGMASLEEVCHFQGVF